MNPQHAILLRDKAARLYHRAARIPVHKPVRSNANPRDVARAQTVLPAFHANIY
jgi:hypothetical protein